MTDYYVDYDTGSDGDDGSTWALGKLTLAAGVALMTTDNDRLFVQGAAGESGSGSVTLTANVNTGDVHFIYGCKDGTSAEPPTDSDIAVRGTDTLPSYTRTGGGSITFDGCFIVTGMDLDADASIVLTSDTYCEFEGCVLTYDSTLVASTGDASLRIKNCDMDPFDTGAGVNFFSGNPAATEILGGILSGDTTFSEGDACGGLIMGLDMEAAARAALSGVQRHNATFFGCGLHASGGLPGSGSTRDFIGSDSMAACATADPSAGASIRDYQRANVCGTCLSETTAIRTGGSDDGVSGGWSYALTPYVDSTNESGQSIHTPWMSAWVDGDDSTEFTLAVYIANSGGADYNADDAWIDWITLPIVAARTWDYSTTRQLIAGGTTAIPDDTGSTWGTGGSNHQKFTKAFTPRIAGLCMARVCFAKRFAAAPETLYVDGMLHVT